MPVFGLDGREDIRNRLRLVFIRAVILARPCLIWSVLGYKLGLVVSQAGIRQSTSPICYSLDSIHIQAYLFRIDIVRVGMDLVKGSRIHQLFLQGFQGTSCGFDLPGSPEHSCLADWKHHHETSPPCVLPLCLP